MRKMWFRFCSMLLVMVMVINMLPLQIFAEQLNTEELSPITPSTNISEQESVSGQIVEELTDKRTEYTKQFRMDNGQFMAVVYNDPVHYEKDGQWVEIDNTLKAQLNGTYTNTAGVWDVSFPNQLTQNNRISIAKDGYTLSFGMAGELRTSGDLEIMSADDTAELSTTNEGSVSEPLAVTQAQTATVQLETVDVAALKAEAEHPEIVAEKLRSGLLYSNVYGTTDIRYDLSSNKVKESIILESYSSTLRGYRYTLDVGEMNPVLQEDGSIHFCDAEKKEIIMVMEAPFLVDDAMEFSYDVQVQLSGSGSTYTLTYLLPTAWLASSDRAWPVTLDPTITPKLATSNIRDVTVCEGKTYSATWGMNSCGYSEQNGIMRFYVKYLYLPALTSSDVVVNATMRLYKSYDSAVSVPVEAHKVLATWESATTKWSNKPAYDPVAEDYDICEDTGYYYWDVTDIARGWYEGENTGMMFKVTDEAENATASNFKQFLSADYDDDADVLPALTIQFRNNNGLEGYWDYTAASAGRAGSGYVNSYTGNLVWVRGDIGFGGNRMPVSISHVYNANDALAVSDSNNSNNTAGNAFGLGNGWRTNYNQLVYQWSGDSTYYVWEDSDGTDHYFKLVSTGVYEDEDGLELTLTTTGSGTTKYCITDKNGNASYFDTNGRLTKIENNQATKSSVTIAYSGTTKRITSVTDGVGRVYNFTYNSSNLLTKISYVGSGTTELSYVSYSYDSSKNLTAVTDKDGEACAYTYGTNNLLLTAQDIDGYKLTYTYNTVVSGKPARIHTVTESHNGAEGGKLTFTYQHNQTTITDKNSNKQILQFNNMGNTVCIQDGEGRAQYAQFAKNDAESTAKGNQLTMASKLQYTVGNMAKDSSFESSTVWTAETAGTAACSISSTAYHGSKSLCVTAEEASNLLGSSFVAAAGGSYTFSAYAKVSGGSVKLALRNTDNTADICYSEELTENTWTRLEVCYTNNTESAVTLVPILSADANTTVYMDCVQIEKAPTASRYNLVENGDFRYSNYAWTSSAGMTTATSAAPQLDNSVYQITGSPTAQQSISQTVQVSGSAEDSFVFGGWAKGNAAPLWEKEEGEDDREFAIQLEFNYTDGSTSNPFTAQFNPDSNEGQYVAAAAVAAQAYSSVTIRLVYDYNVNTVCFDGIQLFKEQFGTSYTYDENGNVTSVVDLQKQTTTYEYDANNNLTKVIQDNKAKMTYTYDTYHNVLTATSEEGLVYTFAYDTWGNNTSVSIGSGTTKITSSAVYTEDGNRLVSTTDALGKTTTYDYNADTNVLNWVKYPEDTDTTKTTYTYDSMYRMASAAVTTDTGLNLSASYTYEDDLLTKIQTASTTYNFTYGNFGLRSSVKVGTQALATYSYTQDGNNYLSSLDYGNGDQVQYEYDHLGRVTKQTYEDGDTVTYKYDNSGALATVTDSATGRKTTYYYDFTDRLMKYVETGSNYYHSVGYEYDQLNNLTSLVETINGTDYTTSYVYDDDNRVTSVTTNGTTVEYTYDAYGRISQQVTKRGDTTILTETYTYVGTDTTTSGQIATYKTETANYSVTYTYTYDDNGNILSVNDSTYTTSYVYDSANQLIRENNQQRNKTYTWTYDNAGNILSQKAYAYTTGEITESTATAVTNSYTYGDENWSDLLTAYNGTAISYDEIGNPTSDGTWAYTWEHGRQLGIMSNSTETWTYTYNTVGLRTKRTNGTEVYEYVYTGGQLVQMKVNNFYTFNFTYDASGTPQNISLNGYTYYYVTNIQGDVVGILNEDGVEVVRYGYDAWGNVEILCDDDPISAHNPLLYRGYIYDFETGLYYLQSRYYDPTLGRFLNADALVSTGQGFVGNNMFAYCLNNPSTMADPTGQVAWGAVVCPVVFPEIFSDTGNTVYESEEDAAFAAGVDVRTLTNSDDCEYICGIYRLNCGGYTVGACFKGKHDSADPNDVTGESTGYSDRTLIAMVHSHPYCTGHIPNEFSQFDSNGRVIGDLLCAFLFGMPIYLAAPNGELKVLYVYDVQQQGNYYTFKRGEESVRRGLPIDDSLFDCRK